MTKKRFPKSHDSHLNSERAYKNLSEVFPEHWKKAPIRDDRSGIEYGQDWLIQLTNDHNELHGEEFRIQSKATPKIYTSTVPITLKISTYNYLANLPLPVLLHNYSVKEHKGYWIWLDDWHAQNYVPQLQERKTITIRIPKENVLDNQAVEKIAVHVKKFHFRVNFIKRIAAANQHDPNYQFQSIAGPSDQFLISIFPKHVGSPPIPLIFDNDLGADQKISDAIARGEAFEVDGKFAENVLANILPIEMEDLYLKLKFFPMLSDERVPLQINLLDENGNSFFEIPYIELSVIQAGTELKIWEGHALRDNALVFTISEDVQNGTTFTFRLNPSCLKVSGQFEYFQFYLSFERTHKIRLKNLKNSEEQIIKQSSRLQITEDLLNLIKFVNNLKVIEEKLNKQFAIPEQFKLNSRMFKATKIIVDIITNGETSEEIISLYDIPKEELRFFGVLTKSNVTKLLEDYKQNTPITFDFVKPVSFKFLNEEIDLGQLRHMLSNVRIGNVEKLTELVSSDLLDDDEIHVELSSWETILIKPA